MHESPPHWDKTKDAIIGGAPQGIFNLTNYRAGDVIPGDWWHVEDDGRVVGYGWMGILLVFSGYQAVFDKKTGANTQVIEDTNRRLAEMDQDRHPTTLRDLVVGYAGKTEPRG